MNVRVGTSPLGRKFRKHGVHGILGLSSDRFKRGKIKEMIQMWFNPEQIHVFAFISID